MTLRWTWCRFGELDADSVYDMLALRNRIFVVEQNCAYLDPDGLDRDSWHLLGRDEAGVLRAYLRVVDPGLKFAEPSIGRVVLDAAMRGSGAADELLRVALQRCDEVWPGRGNRIGAQAHLQRFYGRHGFVTAGDPYDEDGIAHVDMWRAPR